MISIIFEFITRILIWIIKNIFDMISFFMRQLFRLLRFFVALLPVTGIIYTVFFCLLVVSLLGTDISVAGQIFKLDTAGVKSAIFETASQYLTLMDSYGGTLMYFVLLFLLLILFLPVLCILLAVGTFVCSLRFLMIGLLADAFIYLVIGVILGKKPGRMFLSRYKLLFPNIGRRMDEKSYGRWLRRHSDEFEDDTFSRPTKRRRSEEFYGDAEYDGAEYDDRDYDEYEDDEDSEDSYEEESGELYYDEDYDDSDDVYYEDNYEDDEYYDDEYEDEEYNDDEDADGSNIKGRHSAASFDFFAGCTSLESAERKYKQLVKLYHPDNMDGDTAALQEINVQFANIKKRFK